ncbi:Uncharacterized protein BP5553_06841 [Venustampulla echinocandica]|uniref:NAD(P)-binding domain-containing protein n=1 Tax=Venustampulla echinocandica TaxID=2656787 RepID=A0A370TL26_9HELO|nr:Uncharacterized protein BP5553_06841 [Venustampulla echinocandica]RDL36229.1 Uncharacterized protein BP5553_06841 [Venustampulla echinocandica]
MKLIVAGSTGFVATEVIRQALFYPAVTSIVALARRETTIPQNVGPDADAAKLKSVVCEDFGNYPESVKKELAGADACIWLIAVTPSKQNKMPWGEVRKICLDYTVTGIETMGQMPRASTDKPFRFIYTSGAHSERDPSKKPWLLGDYCVMRGEAESRVLGYAKKSGGAIEACVAKPGLIDAPGRTGMVMNAVRTVGCSIIGLPRVDVSEVAATLLDQAIKGFEKETLLNEDLVRIGQKALADQQKDS